MCEILLIATGGNKVFFFLEWHYPVFRTIRPRLHGDTWKPSDYEPRGIWDEVLGQWSICRLLLEGSNDPNGA